MISMTMRTSITSINGVVFISIITSPSDWPTLIAITSYSYDSRLAPNRRLGDESDFVDAAALAEEDNAADIFVACLAVATDVDFRLLRQHRHARDQVEQRIVVGHQR